MSSKQQLKEAEEEAKNELLQIIKDAHNIREVLNFAQQGLEAMERGGGGRGLEARIEGLEQTVQASRARKLIKYIRRTGEYKGEIIDFTPAQYRDITGKDPKKAIIRQGKIPWEWALDDIATELGYRSDEALKNDIEKTLKILHQIDELKRERGVAADIDVKWHIYKDFVEGLKPLVEEIDECMRTFSYGEVKQMAIAEKIRPADGKIYMCKELIGKGWRVNGKRLVFE
jgi:soluble cytochrome b562